MLKTTPPEPYAISKDWTLNPGDGAKTVYAMFQDETGSWSAVYSASINLDTVAPVIAIISPNPGTTNNSMPLMQYTVSDGTVVVKLNGNVIQKVSDDLLDLLTPSTYTLRVESTDAAGNMGFASVTFSVAPFSTTVDSFIFSDVAISRNTLNTSVSDQSTIFFTINGPSTVAFRVIPERLGVNGTPVYEMSQVCPVAGAYLFTWDGHDLSGRVVPDEAYLVILAATDGIKTVTYSPPAPTGMGSVSCSQGTGYDPYRNDPLTVNYSVSETARINVSINWAGSIFKVIDSAPYAPGSYTFDWNGRSQDGKILTGSATAQCTVASLLGQNVIITSGNTPKVALLRTDPYAIQLSYGEFTRISYSLSRDANVTIQLLPPSGAAITLLNGQAQTAGAHEIIWNGIDPSDESNKKLQILREGDYTVLIQAMNPGSGANSTSKGSLRILQ